MSLQKFLSARTKPDSIETLNITYTLNSTGEVWSESKFFGKRLITINVSEVLEWDLNSFIFITFEGEMKTKTYDGVEYISFPLRERVIASDLINYIVESGKVYSCRDGSIIFDKERVLSMNKNLLWTRSGRIYDIDNKLYIPTEKIIRVDGNYYISNKKTRYCRNPQYGMTNVPIIVNKKRLLYQII